VVRSSEIKKILVVSLTNIGDVILTFPVLDILKRDYPTAELSVVIGPKAESLFSGNSEFKKIYIFDKRQPALKTLKWVLSLRRERFNLVVDLRNTAIPLMIAPRYRTSCRIKKTDNCHMREKHLQRLHSIHPFDSNPTGPKSIFITESDRQYVSDLIGQNEKYVVVAPGAADASKRWPVNYFSDLCRHFVSKYNLKIIIVGSDKDRMIADRVNYLMESKGINLCGKTNLVQLAELFKKCFFSVTNDSAPMHLASYMKVPVLGLFGPTDPVKYGPWSPNSHFLRKNQNCRICADSNARGKHTCMEQIRPQDVISCLQIDIQNNTVHFKSNV